jgi:ferredoxin
VALEVRVDRSRCIGTKSCVYAAPGVFELDDNRIATVRAPDAEPLDAVIEAAESCPTSAISVFADGRRRA